MSDPTRERLAEFKTAHQKIVDALFGEIDRLMQERDNARQKGADAYQVVANLLGKTDAFDSDEGQRALDYFADEEGPNVEDFLPWPAKGQADE